MFFGLFDIKLRKDSTETVALQAVGMLSAMIFLVNYTFELLVINGLYPAQYTLIALMLLTLCMWSIIEVGVLKHKRTPIPLTSLSIALWAQVIVVLVRHVPQSLEVLGLIAIAPDGSPAGLVFIVVFGPVYVVTTLLLAKLLINAFSYAEFVRAEQLADQMATNRLAQEELRLSEARYRLIADRAGDVIWTVSEAGAVTYVSPSVEYLIGYKPAELMHTLMRDIVAPNSLMAAVEAYKAALDAVRSGLPLPAVRGEFELIRKDRSTVWIESSTNALQDSAARIIGLVVIARDISERKQLEAGLLRARDAAVAADLAKSRFLTTMSHEIRTPMTAVMGLANLLTQADITDAERIEYASAVVDSGDRLMTIINSLLDLSKIEANKVELEQIALDPASILAQSHALFAPSALAKGLAMTFQWHSEGLASLASYRGDPHRVTQMLFNLVNNAQKFTRKGLIRIEGYEVEHDDSAALLEFSVSDTGCGIAKDKLDLLYQDFSQANSAVSRNYGGSGLGLSIVRKLTELMGGTVGVESTLGQGSRFWFRIRVTRLPAHP
jgi:PAS domain S-box-containing protein